MGQTYSQIRELTAKQLGLTYITGTVDSSGSTTNILRAVALTRYADRRLSGMHLLLTSGSPTFTELFVRNSFQQDGDLLFRPELGAAPDSLTFELLPFAGTDFLRSTQDAILQLYDLGLLSRDFWIRMVGGSPIYNADWSYWNTSTTVDGWTLDTTTLGRERASGNLALSETSLALTTASGFISLDEQYQRFLDDFKGDTVLLHCLVKTSAASTARIAIYDGTTINYSSYHGGGDDWEMLTVELATSKSDSQLQPRLYADTTTTAYFDMPWVSQGSPRGTGRVRAYPFPDAVMPDGPYETLVSILNVEKDDIAAGRGYASVRQPGRARSLLGGRVVKHHDENATTQTSVLDFSLSGRPPLDDQLLWLRGDGPLTVPTSALSTDVLEVTQSEGLMLATVVAINLLERASVGAPSSTRRTYGQRLSELQTQLSSLIGGAGEERSVAQYSLGW